MARRRRPEEPKPDPGDPPSWLWRFHEEAWQHVEVSPMPADFGFGEHFWREFRLRDAWKDACRGWLRDNDLYLWPHWPEDRDEFRRVMAEEPRKVLRHDRDRPLGWNSSEGDGVETAGETSGVRGGFKGSGVGV